MNDNWFVFSDGQQLGPYTGEQLIQFARDGSIVAETPVWAEGMADWLPAAQIPGLFAAPAAAPVAAPVATAVATAPAAWTPRGAQPAQTMATGNVHSAGLVSTAPPGGPYPYFPVKAVGYGMWMGTFIGALASLILMMVSFIAAGAAHSQAPTPEIAQEIANSRIMMGMVMLVVFAVCCICSVIFSYINLYRAWVCLQPGGARVSPGKAIGMLFIPFFNLYWMFVAIAGLPKEWNRIMASYEGLQTAPRMKDVFFLLFCIGSLVFPPLALAMIFPVMSQICRGVNFFAFRRDPNKPSPFSAPGGLRFK